MAHGTGATAEMAKRKAERKKRQRNRKKQRKITKKIAPQSGPQERFLSSSADIVIYGGAAGGGKSFALLLDAMRYHDIPGFSAVLFRQTFGDITNPGGLWDSSMEIYPYTDAEMSMSNLSWKWKSGARVVMSHFQHPKYKLNWQGAQICMIGWDELTHFSKDIFFYMLSRNRSTCGVKPYIRCTTNPDPDSWVREFIDWWIGEDGLPIVERDGVIRYFVKEADEIIWGSNVSDLPAHLQRYAKSVTFIAASLSDNPALMKADPNYMGNLMALPRHQREALLGGNWDIRAAPGLMFNRAMFEIVDTAPPYGEVVRFWDRAATEPCDSNPNPDWTVGLKLLKGVDGYWYVLDIIRFRGKPTKVRNSIRNISIQETEVVQVLEQEPGSSGVADIETLITFLEGIAVDKVKASKDKVLRATPVSAQAGTGNIRLLRAEWNTAFLSELEKFPVMDDSGKVVTRAKDDQVDALSGAFNYISLAMMGPRVRS